MKYLFNFFFKLFGLSTTMREKCYIIMSVSIKIMQLDIFFTPIIEYFFFQNVENKTSFKFKQYF